MKRPSFLNGVGAAAVLTFLASVGFTVLPLVFAFSAAYTILVPALGLAYILYLLSHSPERVGRVTTVTIWAAISVVAWVFESPVVSSILIQVAIVWVIRSLYFYSSMVPALMDLGLNGLSLATALWAITHSGSLFLSLWCFFLLQALFVAIPSTLNLGGKASRNNHPDSENFVRARRQAEAAIQQLFAQ